MEGDGRQWKAMEGNGRRWEAMEGKGEGEARRGKAGHRSNPLAFDLSLHLLLRLSSGSYSAPLRPHWKDEFATSTLWVEACGSYL
jgi:hypothetical protein